MEEAGSTAKRAQDFYNLFRSGNHLEIKSNLLTLAENTDVDKHDLAFLMVILRSITDSHLRRVVLHDQRCLSALTVLLENVQQNEASRNSKPFPQDVADIEDILRAPPLSPDFA